ncbi:MAG: type I toxin-antitoxin system Fst family toxin [Streptococcaceae bacterium]|nr:type I toxin-antitoxin system Fst family toxin [Streptococcaceae bacterium]
MYNSIKEITITVIAGMVIAVFTKWLDGKDK